MSSEIPKPTAHRILSLLEEKGILKVLEPGSGRRSAVLVFPRLLSIAEGKEIV
jgi:Fe2+ or Zn2+ uptake regulation protein